MIPDITHIIATMIANPPRTMTCISVKDAAAAAVKSRPTAYGLSTEYALRRYRALKRGSLRLANPLTAQLWQEIVSKVDLRLTKNPNEDDFAALDYVLSYETPSQYFLTPEYAEKAFYRKHRRRIPKSTPKIS